MLTTEALANLAFEAKFVIFDADTIFEKLTIPGRVGNFSKICSRVKKPNFAQNGVLQEPQQ